LSFSTHISHWTFICVYVCVIQIRIQERNKVYRWPFPLIYLFMFQINCLLQMQVVSDIINKFWEANLSTWYCCSSSLWKKCVSANTEAETQTQKNFKFLKIRLSLHFGPVSEGRNIFFPETQYFPKTGHIMKSSTIGKALISTMLVGFESAVCNTLVSQKLKWDPLDREHFWHCLCIKCSPSSSGFSGMLITKFSCQQ
jgi:hypothetical protein